MSNNGQTGHTAKAINARIEGFRDMSPAERLDAQPCKAPVFCR